MSKYVCLYCIEFRYIIKRMRVYGQRDEFTRLEQWRGGLVSMRRVVYRVVILYISMVTSYNLFYNKELGLSKLQIGINVGRQGIENLFLVKHFKNYNCIQKMLSVFKACLNFSTHCIHDLADTICQLVRIQILILLRVSQYLLIIIITTPVSYTHLIIYLYGHQLQLIL